MPQTTVAAIITKFEENSTEVLLTQRNIPPFKGQWCLPGGHIDKFEPSRAAVIREVKEETGLDFTPTFFRHFDEIIPAKGLHAVVLVYQGIGVGALDAQPDEVSAIRWFSLDEARALPLAFSHNDILEAFTAWKLQKGR